MLTSQIKLVKFKMHRGQQPVRQVFRPLEFRIVWKRLLEPSAELNDLTVMLFGQLGIATLLKYPAQVEIMRSEVDCILGHSRIFIDQLSMNTDGLFELVKCLISLPLVAQQTSQVVQDLGQDVCRSACRHFHVMIAREAATNTTSTAQDAATEGRLRHQRENFSCVVNGLA